MMNRRLLSGFCAGIICLQLTACAVQQEEIAQNSETSATEQTTVISETTALSTSVVTTQPEPALNQNEMNTIAWLNYIALLTQEAYSEKNNRLFLDDIYNEIFNNSNLESLNEETKTALVNLQNTIESYKMTDTKRDRILFLYEQAQTKAIRESIKNAVNSGTSSKDKDSSSNNADFAAFTLKILTTFTVDLLNGLDNCERDYLMQDWELTNAEEETLHQSRVSLFEHAFDIIKDNPSLEQYRLTDQQIEDFIACKQNTNLHQQISFLEDYEQTYQMFGSYWLLKASCYYQDGQYAKCINCVSKYKGLGMTVLKKDHELANVIPYAIASAAEVKSTSEYIKYAEENLQVLTDNIETDDWALRYYAAEVYVDLANKSGGQEARKKYLNAAYALCKTNITFLAPKQSEINATYLNAVQKVAVPADATKAEKKQIKAYNDELEKKRETELPETYEPLALNCELLFALADELDIDQREKDRITGILTGDGDPVFLTKPLQQLFSFSEEPITVSAEFAKDELVIPVSLVSEDAKIKVTVTRGDKWIANDDWKIDEVERGKDFSAYQVTYTSKNAKSCDYKSDSIVTVEITNGDYAQSEPYVITFYVSKYSKTLGIISVEFAQTEA